MGTARRLQRREFCRAQWQLGDTITTVKGATTALPGYKEVQPVVFCGLFPVDAADFEKLRESIGKLRLNDASFSYEMESSAALGFGFRCGFLGLLHLEIIQVRLTREYDLDLITTAPSVEYRLQLSKSRIDAARELVLHSPADWPDPPPTRVAFSYTRALRYVGSPGAHWQGAAARCRPGTR